MKYLFVLIVLFGLSVQTASAADEVKRPIEVMVLGSYHFANPGKDVVNTKSDDVTTDSRQSELRALTDELQRFQPDRILIETQSKAADFSVASYQSFAVADLAKKRGESIQIGFRLANMLGHENVFGFDERASAGEPDYFPMGKLAAFAKENGKSAKLGALVAEVQAYANKIEALQPCRSVSELLSLLNRQSDVSKLHGKLYYGLLTFGDADNQVGAELNAYWYMRNAKMFAKIDLIAKPGERIFVLVGAGHKFWLEHFIRAMPGYVLADPTPYLANAARATSLQQPITQTCD